jgi:hypothetical protein
MFIEPPTEVAVAPTVAAINTETPKPPPTIRPLPTPTQKRPMPTPIEPTREFIFRNLVNVQGRGVSDEEAYNEMAQGWGITVDIVKAIEAEGIEKGWLPTTTPMPPTPVPPTATPDLSAVEEAYLLQFHEIIGIYADTSHEFALLEHEVFSDFPRGGIAGWNSRWRVVDETISQTGERVRGLEVPARYERVQQELRQASRHFEDASGALLTGARRQDYLISVNRTCTTDESCRLNIKRARRGLELASECIAWATKKIEQLALPVATLPATASDSRVTAEESAYLTQYDMIVTDYLYSVSELQSSMQVMRGNSWLMTDEEWLSETTDLIAMWTTRGKDARKLEAPPRLKGVHRELVQASKHYDRAGALLTEEISAGNADRLPSPSHDEMALGWECLERATDELEKYLEGLGKLKPRTPTPVGITWHEVGRWERGEMTDPDNYEVQTEYFHIPSYEWRVSWDTWPGENYGEAVFWISALPASGARGTDIANLIGAHKGMATMHGAGSYRLFIQTWQAYRIVVEAKY